MTFSAIPAMYANSSFLAFDNRFHNRFHDCTEILALLSQSVLTLFVAVTYSIGEP